MLENELFNKKNLYLLFLQDKTLKFAFFFTLSFFKMIFIEIYCYLPMKYNRIEKKKFIKSKKRIKKNLRTENLSR